jgi:beta-glucosidase
MDKIDQILEAMTLEDKIALCSGASFWETKKYEEYWIPSLFMCDGPSGLRKQEGGKETDMLGINESRSATCFPAEVTGAASWDPKLLTRVGAAIGLEAHDQSVSLVLAPGANLKRNPLCGRNFEYFSEDPYLSGKLAAGFIQGIEATGVGASLKHFAANSQEKCRFVSDSVIDSRTLRENYLTNFEIAVKEGKPSTVMCAYPKLNGIYCSDNKELLTDILREEWGYDGTVVTDWGAMNDRIQAFLAGCDLSMPGGSAYMEKDVLEAVKSGSLPQSCVDISARRILKLVYKAVRSRGEASENPDKVSACDGKTAACDYEAHHILARTVAEQGAVLLKNDDDILPLKSDSKVALIGAMAKNLRFQGAGSSHVNPTKVSQPIEYFPNAAYALGCDDNGHTTDEWIAEAQRVAGSADLAVIIVGLPPSYESEGFDRDDMKLPEGHNRLIEAVTMVNSNTVVVLLSGSVVECPWADRVKGILYMGLPGQAGGEAMVNLLYGKVSPSGKLAETWPLYYGDVPSSDLYGKTSDALYAEGIYVGYRYYDKSKREVRWPFGYGLSYTRFVYSDLQVKNDHVTVTVKNVGRCPGCEVVQLYIEPPQGGLHRPLRELKGFQKVFLEAGSSIDVSFQLDDRSFSLWNDGWQVPGGTYTIQIGELSAIVNRPGESIPAPAWQNGTWYENCQGKPIQADLEAAMGKQYNPVTLVKGNFTMGNTVEEMKDYSLVMKIMFKAVERTIAKGFGGKIDYQNPDFRMMMAASVGAPLRSLQISGGLKDGLMQGMLEMANGHFLRGIRKMITS